MKNKINSMLNKCIYLLYIHRDEVIYLIENIDDIKELITYIIEKVYPWIHYALYSLI